MQLFISLYDNLKIIFMIIEILLNFNQSYFKKGVLYIKRINIAKNYLKNRFFLDLLLLLIFIIFKGTDHFAEIIIVFRYNKMIETFNLIT